MNPVSETPAQSSVASTEANDVVAWASPVASRTAVLYHGRLRALHTRTDRLFVWLLLAEWAAAVAAALWITPLTWIGSRSELSPNLWAAIVLGGLIVGFPILVALCWPGRTATRHCVAASQMLLGALLIHLTGGRIETHFYVFGSLAFLAFYRDWRVILTATVVVAADHFIRGQFFPQSVFGVATASQWRWLEHAGWVVFEDFFLIQACRRGLWELWAICERQAELERTNAEIEQTVMDRTAELRERTDQLQENQQFTEQIIDTANDAFVGLDAPGHITNWNDEAEALFGWSKSEILGQPFETVIPPEHRDTHREDMKQFVATGTSALVNSRTEVLALHRDGHVFPVEMNLWPVRRGDAVRFNAFFSDITARKETERALREAKDSAESANRAKSEFLANMSHEIRTPMNGIIGMANLAMDTDLTPLQREYLDMLVRSAGSLLGIINDILDFSKIEAGKLSLDLVPFSLRDCIEDLMKELSVRAAEKGLELTHHIAVDVPDGLVGDVGRLRQVLMNLIGNAIKFTEKGEVAVHVRCGTRDGQDARVHFAVRDTGIGIPPEKLRSIFLPFEQADKSTTRRFGGTGLGLTISRQIVALMGGSIAADSDPGRGSVFHFDGSFLITDQVVRRKPLEPQPDLRGRSVLVVDDNETNRRLLFDTLLGWNMAPRVVENGPAALAALDEAAAANRPFDLVLLDVMMPDMDGFAVAQAARTHPGCARSPIMMLSSADRQEDAARCRTMGIDSYLTKPVTQSDLFNAILGVLRLRTAGEADAPAAPPVAAHSAVPAGLRILVAEDNVINQKLTQKILELKGHQVTIAANGKLALDAMAGRPFDLVLMDIQMPEMDGFEATAEIRKREAGTGHRMPVIAMTAHALKGDRERCLDAGMDGYVSKPVEPDALWKEMAAVSRVEAPKPAAAHAPAATGEILDRARIDSLREMDADGALLRELIDLFRADGPQMLADLRAAVDSRDPKALSKKAHLLKGSLLSLGAVRARDLAQRIEQLGKDGRLDDAAALVPDLDRLIPPFLAELDKLCPQAC